MKVTSPCYFWRLVVVIVLCCQSFSVIAQQPPKQQPESQSETTQECTVDEQTQQVACQPADDEKKNQNDDDSSTTTPEGDSLIAHGLRQIQWMRETCGGFVSEKFAIRRDNANRLGAFATGHFRMGETILEIPRQCILQTDHDDICETVELLREEMRKGEDSFFAPYTNYLSQTQLYGQLPALWSEPGQAKLPQLLGKSLSPEDSSVFVFEPYLPPDQAVHLQGCPSVAPLDTPELEKLHTYASMLVTQRGWDEVLVPLLDMLAHRNGQHWFNTDNNSVHANKDNDHEDNDIEENRTNDTPVRVWAKHDIAPGQELFSSYSHCTDCGARKTGYGTPEILRDYGFVEMYPQKWRFPEQILAFTLDYADYNNPQDGNIQLTWDPSTKFRRQSHDQLLETADFFRGEINRLQNHVNVDENMDDIPEHEWDAIRSYHSALITAMSMAVESLPELAPDCFANATNCHVQARMRYDPLAAPSLNTAEATRPYSCDTEVSMDFAQYVIADEVESAYQRITFFQDPVTKDMCFDLDDTYQQCTSYRPQYHEMVLHYTARFLPDIRRILFVGGGDSMLLHEALQYPNLEIVIGLELDQVVTRLSFTHFGSQPHWDNPKVQWWYGDAGKSLLMLPEEYFGTFDMVLVDLSETVMSQKVTRGLDILGALSLLLKPNGIFVKNELYLAEMSKLFQYSLQIHYYNVSVICSQCLILGSNTVDFIDTEPTDHKVSVKVDPLKDISEHSDVMHSYAHNASAKMLCLNDSDFDSASEIQESSPGILMILEAENARDDWTSVDMFKDELVRSISNIGLKVISAVADSSWYEEYLVHIVLQEGYIIARVFQSTSHCAFDLHLWSAFRMLEEARRALLDTVQPKSDNWSQFRIVAGGVFGLPSWREDEKSRGPQSLRQHCISNAQEKSDDDTNQSVDPIEALLQESISTFISEESSIILVLCGEEDDSPCESLSNLNRRGDQIKVFPVFTCPELKGRIAPLDLGDKMYSCEMQMTSILSGIAAHEKISTVIVDPSASKDMARILHKLISRDKNVPKQKIKTIQPSLVNRGPARQRIFSQDMLVLAPQNATKPQKWRPIFVEKFRSLVLKEPAFFSMVKYNNSVHNVEMSTFLSGDRHFISRLKGVVERVEKQSALSGRIETIEGGYPTYQEDFVSSQVFQWSDFDNTGAFDQWKNQKPRGRQTVLQMEAGQQQVPITSETIRDAVTNALKGIISAEPALQSASLGDGFVVLAPFTNGNVAIVWDGRSHVDINFYTLSDNPELLERFQGLFVDEIPSLKAVLKDEFPRGHGRVVNFETELEVNPEPYWGANVPVQ